MPTRRRDHARDHQQHDGLSRMLGRRRPAPAAPDSPFGCAPSQCCLPLLELRHRRWRVSWQLSAAHLGQRMVPPGRRWPPAGSRSPAAFGTLGRYSLPGRAGQGGGGERERNRRRQQESFQPSSALISIGRGEDTGPPPDCRGSAWTSTIREHAHAALVAAALVIAALAQGAFAPDGLCRRLDPDLGRS